LGASVPIYNYLLDKLEDFRDESDQDADLKVAATLAINKLKDYYPMTDGLSYIVATSKLIKALFIMP
jgi:hypothetical protein